MKVLIVCSGNFADFSLEKHQAFIYDQVNAISKHYSHIDFSVFPINGQGIMGYLKNLKLLKETIRKEKVDLIHAHFSLSGMLSVLQRKVPVIVTFHGSDINLPKINLISSVVSLFSTYSIFVSTALHDNIYIKRRKKHNFIIPCGVDFEIFKPITQNIRKTFVKNEIVIRQATPLSIEHRKSKDISVIAETVKIRNKKNVKH